MIADTYQKSEMELARNRELILQFRLQGRPRTALEVTTMDEVMFKDFQTLMLKRKRTVDDLVDILRGKIEEPREFFERVMS